MPAWLSLLEGDSKLKKKCQFPMLILWHLKVLGVLSGVMIASLLFLALLTMLEHCFGFKLVQNPKTVLSYFECLIYAMLVASVIASVHTAIVGLWHIIRR